LITLFTLALLTVFLISQVVNNICQVKILWQQPQGFPSGRPLYSGLTQWNNGAYEESWTFVGMTLSEMPTYIALPTSHHFHPSLSPIVSLFSGILHEWMKMQAIFEPPPERWRRPPGQLCTTWMKNINLSSLDLGIHEARDLAQNQPLCRLM